MKKTLLTLMAMACGMAGYAQTNFRSLTFDQAVEAAKAENKLVFIDVYTSWCGPCKKMASDVFPQKKVGDFMNEHFVCIKLDAEKEGADVAKLFNVRAYPTFVIAGTDKKEVNTLVGYNEGDAFIEKVKNALNPELTPAKMKERYAKGERTPELMKAYINHLQEEASLSYSERKAKMDEIKKIATDYFKGLDDKARLSSDNMFLYKQFADNANDVIFQYMAANKNKFAEADRKKVNEIVTGVVNGEVGKLLSGKNPYTADALAKIKKLVNDNGLNADKSFDTAYKFIEASAMTDKMKYLDFCQKNFKGLNEEQLNSLTSGFAKLFDGCDNTVKEKAAKFLRSKLADMPVIPMYNCVQQIYQLEVAKK